MLFVFATPFMLCLVLFSKHKERDYTHNVIKNIPGFPSISSKPRADVVETLLV